MIRHERAGRRHEACLTEPYPDAGEHELQKALRQAAEHRHGRPYGRDGRDDAQTVHPLRETPEGNAKRRVKNGEAQSAQQADLQIGELEVYLDGLREHVEHRAVREVERADDEHREEEQTAVGSTQELALLRRVMAHRLAHASSSPSPRVT